MRFSALVVLALCAAAFAADEIEDGVYVGTDANFKQLVGSTEFVLAEFYAPWCGHCKSLAPEYAKAAKALSDMSNVKLVKVDATIHAEVAEEFQVQGYPTLRWFKNGKDSEYTGGRTASEITSWVRRRSGPPSTTVESAADAQNLFKANDVVVFGAFENAESSQYKSFVDAAGRGELTYAHTFNAAAASELGLSVPSVTAFKKFDEGKATYSGDFAADSIAEFASSHSLPLVNEFSEETAGKIFGGNVKKHLLLFVNKESDKFAAANEALKAVAPAFRGRMLFIIIDTNVEGNERVLEFFGLSEADTPAIRVIDLSKDMSKFAYTEDITTDKLTTYLNNFFEGKIKRHLNSQTLPADWDAQPVKVLVGSNFEEVALNDKTHAFVEFYAPWCGHCKELAPTWDALAAKLQDRKDVVIAKIDMTGNELEQVSIQSFPTIKLFKIGSKGEPIDFHGERNLEGFVQFLNENIGSTSGATGGAAHDEF